MYLKQIVKFRVYNTVIEKNNIIIFKNNYNF